MSSLFAPLEETVRAHRDELLGQSEQERLVRSARSIHRWRDPAVWAAFVGPLVGLGFLGYSAQEIVRTVART